MIFYPIHAMDPVHVLAVQENVWLNWRPLDFAQAVLELDTGVWFLVILLESVVHDIFSSLGTCEGISISSFIESS